MYTIKVVTGVDLSTIQDDHRIQALLIEGYEPMSHTSMLTPMGCSHWSMLLRKVKTTAQSTQPQQTQKGKK